jgi:hypothetical protein
MLDKDIGNYCLCKCEKQEILKEFFYTFIANKNNLFSSIPNYILSTYTFDEENNSTKLNNSIFKELFYSDFSFNLKDKLLVHIDKTLELIEKEEPNEKEVIIYTINDLNNQKVNLYREVINTYLINKNTDIRIKTEYIRKNHKYNVYCYKLVHYTVTPFFPNEKIMEETLKNL